METWNTRELDFLLAEIRQDVWQTRQHTGRPALNERVLDALRQVPRDAFVAPELRYNAYANHPLPIGHGQTISQPYIVALMTDLVQPRADHVVLEIGTGSGYQAAILSRLVKQVYSVEIIPELARDASARLQRLGYDNVEVRTGNGRLGWPRHAPYDAILVAAAASRVPPALIAQLKPGATLVIPVGEPFAGQDLLLLRKDEHGRIAERRLLPVAFVPLTGTEGDSIMHI